MLKNSFSFMQSARVGKPRFHSCPFVYKHINLSTVSRTFRCKQTMEIWHRVQLTGLPGRPSLVDLHPWTCVQTCAVLTTTLCRRRTSILGHRLSTCTCAQQPNASTCAAVWFSLTKMKTKMMKNERIMNSLTKTKTKTKKWWKLKRN